MRTSEERITELEQRVAYLEQIIQSTEEEKVTVVGPGIVGDKKDRSSFIHNDPIRMRPVEAIENRQKEPRIQRSYQENKGKDKEALVGKYIVGALASVLIFIGAISFISLVWNQLTPEIKLSIISLVGIVLSALGFWLIRSKKNPITAIILGTGAGLLFIAIVSANLVFHMIGNNMSIVLAGIWAVFFILSSRYTNLFFTTIIAYIGSYFTLILGLIHMRGDSELLVLILFASGIAAIMISTTLRKNKKGLITSIILSLSSYITILIRCYMDGAIGTEQRLHSYAAQIIVILIIYLILNLFYKVINNTNSSPIYLGISVITTIVMFYFIIYIDLNYLNLKVITCYILFLVINIIQFILNNIFYKRIEIWLTRYYAVVLCFTSMLINIELFKVPTGIIIIGLLLIVSSRVLKGKEQSFLIGLIVLLDSLFLIFNYSDNLICSIYGILQLGLMGYVLWKSTSLKKDKQINVLKTIGIVVLIINSFGIPSNIINSINVSYVSQYLDNAVGYFIAVLTILVLIKIGYFKDWKSEQFDFFKSKDTLEDDKVMTILLYVISTGLYFYGLQEITYAEYWFLQLILVLSTVALAFIQSKVILLGNHRNNPLAGIWIVIKYFMLAWIILNAISDLDIISVAYSIAGLIVAIGSIYCGFKLKNRNIRLYGLVLTILMVVKFILVDLKEENSIIRVIALIAGGGLCFLISFIYNKLSEK